MAVTLLVGSVSVLCLGLWGLTCLTFPRFVPRALNPEKFSPTQLRFLGIALLLLALVAAQVVVVPYVQLWLAGEL